MFTGRERHETSHVLAQTDQQLRLGEPSFFLTTTTVTKYTLTSESHLQKSLEESQATGLLFVCPSALIGLLSSAGKIPS